MTELFTSAYLIRLRFVTPPSSSQLKVISVKRYLSEYGVLFTSEYFYDEVYNSAVTENSSSYKIKCKYKKENPATLSCGVFS